MQQVNSGGPYKQPKHQAHLISSIDKSLSQNRHRVWSPTHWRAIKEESKVANRDWADHQTCSVLQYINVIANLFIIGNYFHELRWKSIRANNLLQFIHQVTIEFRFWKSMAQERFMSNLEFRYQIIVSSITFRKAFAKLMIQIRSFWVNNLLRVLISVTWLDALAKRMSWEI